MTSRDVGRPTRDESFGASDDRPSNPSTTPSLEALLARRMSRRGFVRATVAASMTAAAPAALAADSRDGAGAAVRKAAFEEVAHGVDHTHHVAPGHDADVLIRWGDPVVAGAPAFDPRNQSGAAQAMQFGYNNDYVGYVPLPWGSRRSDHGLLCVNHEFTSESVMFPAVDGRRHRRRYADLGRAQVAVEMAAHGGTVIEVRRDASGKWRVIGASPFNRRITASTPMRISGPAAGHARMRTAADPRGRRVEGTINNCAGGTTPWGTYLMAEENFQGYFLGDPRRGAEADNHRRYGVPGGWFGWAKFHRRFDIGHEPNEPNRFGWVVEVDPFDPLATPVKRTSLGRFKHEGAECVLNGDGRIVVYMGDDQAFEYLYRFVSDGRFAPGNRKANGGLLDDGILSVARFDEHGSLRWLPLVWGTGPLTPANGFASQADVLIETRRAADLLGATPMDRPEDVEPSPVSQRVYVVLTGNGQRTAGNVDAPNPRPRNVFGHLLELTPPGGDHAAPVYRWEMLVRCGDPARAEVGASWHPATTSNGWFAAPDNVACDHTGRLWVATDQGGKWARTGTADGLWLLHTQGESRGTGRMFFRVPLGAELCGPAFTPDDRSLFLAVQHPAVAGVERYPGFGRRSTFEDPATRWPDFDEGMPPRPSVVVVTRRDGGVIAA